MLQTFQTTLSERLQVTEDVYRFRFALTKPKELEFIAGQYLLLEIPQPDGSVRRKHYSIASSSFNKTAFEILAKIVSGGAGSERLIGLKTGDTASFMGPAGVFTLRQTPQDKIFLATGTGIAPVRSIITSSKFKVQSSKFFLLWGVRTFQEACYFEDFKTIAHESPNFSYTICASREKSLDAIPEEDRKYFFLGRVTDAHEKLILNSSDYYLCGGAPVVEELRQYLLSREVPKESIIFEKFV